MVDFNINDGKELYKGKQTFMNGVMKCPLCNDSMIMGPVGTPFVKLENGGIGVNISQVNGSMNVNKEDLDYLWLCKNCSYAKRG